MIPLWTMQWLLSCAGSLAVGLVAWALLRAAVRWWPALRTRRNVWLAAQAVVAAAALLPLVPHPSKLRLAPQIELDVPPLGSHVRNDAPAAGTATPTAATAQSAATQSAASAPAFASARATAAVADAMQAASPSAASALPLLAAGWLFVYAAGLARAVARQWRARRLLRGLIAGAQCLTPDELQAHDGFTAGQRRAIARHRLTVLRTDAAISPMLIGVRRPRLLLPAHLQALDATQQRMIIAHELHHWRAQDPLCLALAAALRTIFWFNPALRWMATHMEWALELQCDQRVLTGRPQHERKQYAASLLQQWTMMTPVGVAAFNGATVAARLRHMQKDGLPTLSAAAVWFTGAALTVVLVAGALLQPALAFSLPSAAVSPPTMPVVAAPVEAWRLPLDKVRVTSFYGVMRSVLPTPHKGIDFAAAKGTPVHAVASGTVIAAGPIAENDGRYGNVVIIDHGAQRSFFAHLDSVSVTAGQHVQAGALIGATGQSGFATGPHLHMEVRQGGRNIDPASMYPTLDAHATQRALKVRRQQLPQKG
ncbi:beta-lactamase regulating signal transducer with metallopeptidase domain [Duganella sp. 1224]|uniref:M23/M56 family metallopeptidase n=1 Tax=Duganella sp. 1224 TaxID=2587052 RepID=UPI0015C9F3AF|nr:M23/M56 family metallopeptidase [Duganella sp. 1224]NYE60783.1 beta-lactamase regulating signal transducer with metallopeptidase domain [Duganella sp. 1224]